MNYLCAECLREYHCKEEPDSNVCKENFVLDPVHSEVERMAIMENELKRNGSGYADPTAAEAIKRIEDRRKRVKRVIESIRNVANLAGFEIEGRIVLKDKRTGETWI